MNSNFIFLPVGILLIMLLILLKRFNKSIRFESAWVTYNYKLPKQIWRCTHLNKQIIPDNLNKFSDGFVVHPPFNDEKCLQFLEEFFDKEVSQAFKLLKKGAHRADLWRYAVLYKKGGIYMDIKSYPTVSLKTIAQLIDNQPNFTWLAVMNGWKDHIYNGIIATPPNNPIILQCIQHIVANVKEVDKEYHLFCRYLLKLCVNEYGQKVMDAPTILKNGCSTLILLKESCQHNSTDKECKVSGRPGGNRLDQFGLCCNARDIHDNVIFGIRDPNYPYKPF